MNVRGQRVFIDACILFPPLVRSIILSVAEAGLFVPLWSDRVLKEWRISAIRKGKDEDEIRSSQARMANAFPNAQTNAPDDAEAGFHLPDPADVHVVAAAAAANADIILTYNLRDFPRRVLFPLGLEARHPDGFLWEALSTAPNLMAPAIAGCLQANGVSDDRARAALKRARLSRFGKAWESYQGNAPG